MTITFQSNKKHQIRRLIPIPFLHQFHSLPPALNLLPANSWFHHLRPRSQSTRVNLLMSLLHMISHLILPVKTLRALVWTSFSGAVEIPGSGFVYPCMAITFITTAKQFPALQTDMSSAGSRDRGLHGNRVETRVGRSWDGNAIVNRDEVIVLV